MSLILLVGTFFVVFSTCYMFGWYLGSVLIRCEHHLSVESWENKNRRLEKHIMSVMLFFVVSIGLFCPRPLSKSLVSEATN